MKNWLKEAGFEEVKIDSKELEKDFAALAKSEGLDGFGNDDEEDELAKLMREADGVEDEVHGMFEKKSIGPSTPFPRPSVVPVCILRAHI